MDPPTFEDAQMDVIIPALVPLDMYYPSNFQFPDPSVSRGSPSSVRAEFDQDRDDDDAPIWSGPADDNGGNTGSPVAVVTEYVKMDDYEDYDDKEEEPKMKEDVKEDAKEDLKEETVPKAKVPDTVA